MIAFPTTLCFCGHCFCDSVFHSIEFFVCVFGGHCYCDCSQQHCVFVDTVIVTVFPMTVSVVVNTVIGTVLHNICICGHCLCDCIACNICFCGRCLRDLQYLFLSTLSM